MGKGEADDDQRQKAKHDIIQIERFLSLRCNPLRSRTAEVQAGTIIVDHEIRLGLAWLDQKLAALSPRAFIICASIPTARKDPHCVEATVTAAERGNCAKQE
jgi:hypothetical protein